MNLTTEMCRSARVYLYPLVSYFWTVKADGRRRMSPSMRESVAQISAELGIHVVTLYNWRKAWRLQREVVPASKGCGGGAAFSSPRKAPELTFKQPCESGQSGLGIYNSLGDEAPIFAEMVGFCTELLDERN